MCSLVIITNAKARVLRIRKFCIRHLGYNLHIHIVRSGYCHISIFDFPVRVRTYRVVSTKCSTNLRFRISLIITIASSPLCQEININTRISLVRLLSIPALASRIRVSVSVSPISRLGSSIPRLGLWLRRLASLSSARSF